MAPGTLTAGRRVASFDELDRAGDYMLGQVEVEGEDRPYLWFLLPIHEGETKFDRPTPGCGVHGIGSPPWTFRECDDGSVEVRASILTWESEGDNPRARQVWHGYLDEGHVWREV